VDIAQFMTRTHAIVAPESPDGLAPTRDDDLCAFALVSASFVPAFVAALDAAEHHDDGAGSQVAALADLLEAGFADGTDDLVDALAMRVVERHLCRDSARAAIAYPQLGPATRAIVAKLRALVDSADKNAATASLAHTDGAG